MEDGAPAQNRGCSDVTSIILAAGKGTRMLGYKGNKALLPLVPGPDVYTGKRPLLSQVLDSLPAGPKGIVVHHCAQDVQAETKGYGAAYIFQPVTNGTGGALLAARSFLGLASQDAVIITMGDVPLIRPATYRRMVKDLDACDLVLLGFAPRDRLQYGVIEMDGDRVLRIIEWKYWHVFPPDSLAVLRLCNAGVYAVRRGPLLHYMTQLAARPHVVKKKRGDEWVSIEEYFLTDLVEFMSEGELPIGVVVADEEEITGVDTPEALRFVQEQYAGMLVES